ncbi:MAG: N-methyl-L-tryptophan oxidase [Bacteroidota bacterium]
MASNKNTFDVIVIGVGSMGSATCYYLASKGLKVLGLEQFEIPHTLGAHGGQSRIIRKAYFEHPDYVPLLERAYQNWAHLEEMSGAKVFYRTGLVYFGEQDNELMKGIRLSANEYNIHIEALNGQASASKHPQFDIPSSFDTIFEPDAGFILPEKTISLYYELALRAGASIKTRIKVDSWKDEGGGISVSANGQSYKAEKLIITAGAWTKQMVSSLRIPTTVHKQVITWVKPKDWSSFELSNFPCWVIAGPDYPGIFYGFPMLPAKNNYGEVGLKVAHHYPGEVIDPDTDTIEIPQEELEKLEAIMHKYLPGTFDGFLNVKTCKYTQTPDEHFIIDKLPSHENVIIGAGFSGHGFKFVPMVGEALSDLATVGKTDLPIGFLSASRKL